MMVIAQPIAGALHDASGSAAVPVVFTGALMATTTLGLLALRAIERCAPVSRDVDG